MDKGFRKQNEVSYLRKQLLLHHHVLVITNPIIEKYVL